MARISWGQELRRLPWFALLYGWPSLLSCNTTPLHLSPCLATSNDYESIGGYGSPPGGHGYHWGPSSEGTLEYFSPSPRWKDMTIQHNVSVHHWHISSLVSEDERFLFSAGRRRSLPPCRHFHSEPITGSCLCKDAKASGKRWGRAEILLVTQSITDLQLRPWGTYSPTQA